jgi:hypothetical protein
VSDSSWQAMMLAPRIEICEALLCGESVPIARLDQRWVSRFGLRTPAVDDRAFLTDFNSIPTELDALRPMLCHLCRRPAPSGWCRDTVSCNYEARLRLGIPAGIAKRDRAAERKAKREKRAA